MAKNKKKSSPVFKIAVIIVIISFIFLVIKEATGLGTSIFSPDIKGSGSVNKHIPRELRWEKAFRFGDEKEEKGGQNFLQYESSKNKDK
ncbi:hypothetical protein CP960_05830 [Malaciobacter halophilus]|uniref:Uncharacterized protein n=1 Tax=Malaciobacter halophilus TaxID=197482 RepID=A0A2N1J3E1_9BACT|nr:hypothetical protein [Malaciobacter halophilus]AXH09127.1 hypothetical protein AHALO_0742 [Malaciobacter halophilus]PKI81077.1 hypothetical protein CP960_05830 [Malaciobacter halophilus]